MPKPQPEQPVAEQMLTIPETGIRLAVSPRKVWALIAAGEKPVDWSLPSA